MGGRWVLVDIIWYLPTNAEAMLGCDNIFLSASNLHKQAFNEKLWFELYNLNQKYLKLFFSSSKNPLKLIKNKLEIRTIFIQGVKKTPSKVSF